MIEKVQFFNHCDEVLFLFVRHYYRVRNEEYLLGSLVGYISVGDWCSGCICHYSLATWESCWHCPHNHRKRKPRIFPSQRQKSTEWETLGTDQIQICPGHKEKAAGLKWRIMFYCCSCKAWGERSELATYYVKRGFFCENSKCKIFFSSFIFSHRFWEKSKIERKQWKQAA